jgi:uncharacterized membrane-anchored protein
LDDPQEKENCQARLIMKHIIILTGFVIMVIVQWVFPGRMIWNKETILNTGKEFRFRMEPYDPFDAFRGKYVHLAFNQSSVQFKDSVDWKEGDMVYALLSTDSSGFVRISDLSKEEPGEDQDYLKVKTGYIYRDSVSYVSIIYPFDRFYMEESKAEYADIAFREAIGDSAKVTYALIRIQHGEGLVEDVMIDGKPLRQVAIERQRQQDLPQ